MTPKHKAIELVDKFLHPVRWKMGQEDIKQRAKQCALIAVDEIIKAIPDASDDDSPYNHELVWWQEVKHELNKL